ncbi:MAG: hypothetical protein MUF83_19010 [Acidimicrobiales bacterium]|jgi:hypothetical protein|nr:hypothetical protein [Acidimicrobiales bacterium]
MRRVVGLVVALVLLAAACDKALITLPEDGAIVPTDSVQVTGVLPSDLTPGGTLTVNGIPTAIGAGGNWSQVVPVPSTQLVTMVEVLYNEPGGKQWRDRRAVIRGPKVDEGVASPNGVGMRFTNTGLANLGPVIKDLAAGAFDIGGLLLSQNPIITQKDAFLTIDITGNAYEAGVGSVDIAAASTPTGVATDITIDDLYVGVDLNLSDGGLINLACRLELQIPQTTIGATFDLEPSAADPSFVDVNLVGTPAVTTGAVQYEFISGICDGDTFLIGDIVNLVAGPQIQSLIGGGFATNLGDPDGAGPADSPIADAIETALAEISIAGSVGEATKVNLEAPFTGITEGGDAIDFRADADFFSSFGTGPTDCVQVPNAPDLTSTYDVPGAYPTLGATTPSGDPYGLGLVISMSAFNQLLGSMAECGVINQTLTQIPFGGTTLPITSSTLAALVPQFANLAPNTPMFIRVRPTAGPFLTGNPGPNGETAELMLANVLVEFVQTIQGVDFPWLTVAVDAPLGFDLQFDPAANQLAPTITAPPASKIGARVKTNAIQANETSVQTLFPQLFPQFVSALSSSFAAFPLPSFLGLGLDVVEVARSGSYYVLYGNLNPTPQTRLANVTVTDLSTPDSVVDSVFDVNEWRHRLRPSIGPNSVNVAYKGMLGADACCTVDDEARSATAAYRMTFDVIPENGDVWQLNVGQSIAGAHTLIDEKVLLEDAGGETKFQTPVSGRVKVGDGAWQDFSFNPSVKSVLHKLYGGEGTSNRAFSGANGLVLQGSTAQTVTVEFSIGLYVKSNSNIAFPAAGGDEVAIRFGANDTIVNGFSAGGYPGLGNRNILTDGHFATVTLTTVP